MAVISGAEKEKLVELFKDRGVKFYHACQWVDFKSYCSLGGVPSRNLLESSGHDFTKFDTDDRDKENGVWDYVFGNLIDSGTQFAKMGANNTIVATPNFFGPILLVFSPDVFNQVDDIAIALRSAGGKGFNRDEESLSTVEEVNKIFRFENPADADYDQARAYIKFPNDLITSFPGIEKAANPEVSCLVQGEIMPFSYLSDVIVDKIKVFNNFLPYHVYEKLKEFGITCSVEERKYWHGRDDLLCDLVTASVESLKYDDQSEQLKDWLHRIVKTDNGLFFFERFIKYLEQGTINDLIKEAELDYGIFNLPPII